MSCSSPTEPGISPAPITDFRLILGSDISAIVEWTTPEEVPGSDPVSYDLRYSTEPMSSIEDWDNATKVTNLSTPSISGVIENYIIGGLQSNQTYYAAIRIQGRNGSMSDFSNQISIKILDSRLLFEFSAASLYGDTVNSSELKGNQLVLVNFWGAWCGWCKIEMPDLIKIHDKFTDSNVVIVGFNTGDSPEVAIAYSEQMQLPWLNILIPNEVLSYYEIGGFPTTIFLNSSGQEIARMRGYQTYERFEKGIQYLLDITAVASTSSIDINQMVVK